MNINSYLITVLLFLSVITLAGCEEEAWPVGCPHGEVVITNIDDPDQPGAWFDFSEGELVFGEEGKSRGDIYVHMNSIRGNASGNVALADSDSWNSLLYDTTGPSWGSSAWNYPPNETTDSTVPIYGTHCYWVMTTEGNYAKFKVLSSETNDNVTSYKWIKIEWIYQPDGSNELHDVVGAEGEGAEGENGEVE